MSAKSDQSSALEAAFALRDGGGDPAEAVAALEAVAAAEEAGGEWAAAAYELALLLHGLGRHREGDAWLRKLGFRHRLSGGAFCPRWPLNQHDYSEGKNQKVSLWSLRFPLPPWPFLIPGDLISVSVILPLCVPAETIKAEEGGRCRGGLTGDSGSGGFWPAPAQGGGRTPPRGATCAAAGSPGPRQPLLGGAHLPDAFVLLVQHAAPRVMPLSCL